jgi:hypothetical protein
MTFNGIERIKEEAGDYIVLTDYYEDGIAVSHQSQTLEGAVAWMTACAYGNPQSIVKLVRIQATETP